MDGNYLSEAYVIKAESETENVYVLYQGKSTVLLC